MASPTEQYTFSQEGVNRLGDLCSDFYGGSIRTSSAMQSILPKTTKYNMFTKISEHTLPKKCLF